MNTIDTNAAHLNPVAKTALLVAAMRAEESIRQDRLFEDPFAARLAGEDGRQVLATYRTAVGAAVPIIEVRTRFFDERLALAAKSGIRQIVIVAAGMDARAYRLPWPAGVSVFELDQPDVLAYKNTILADAEPTSDRIVVPVDFAHDWTPALRAAGHDPSRPTAWLVEGLLAYLEEATVRALFQRVDRLSAPQSVVLYDVVSGGAPAAPQLANALTMMRDLGAPWVFGTDDPASLLSNAWRVTPFDPGDIGRSWGRWPFPPAPPNAPARPVGYLVEAHNGSAQ